MGSSRACPVLAAMSPASSISNRRWAANAASKLRSQPEIERCLNKYIYPAWGQRPFREIKRGDVADLLDGIEGRHGARQADLVLAIIRKMANGRLPKLVASIRRILPLAGAAWTLTEFNPTAGKGSP